MRPEKVDVNNLFRKENSLNYCTKSQQDLEISHPSTQLFPV